MSPAYQAAQFSPHVGFLLDALYDPLCLVNSVGCVSIALHQATEPRRAELATLLKRSASQPHAM